MTERRAGQHFDSDESMLERRPTAENREADDDGDASADESGPNACEMAVGDVFVFGCEILVLLREVDLAASCDRAVVAAEVAPQGVVRDDIWLRHIARPVSSVRSKAARIEAYATHVKVADERREIHVDRVGAEERVVGEVVGLGAIAEAEADVVAARTGPAVSQLEHTDRSVVDHALRVLKGRIRGRSNVGHVCGGSQQGCCGVWRGKRNVLKMDRNGLYLEGRAVSTH